MKKVIIISTIAAVAFVLTNCAAKSDSTTTTTLTTAGKMSTGLGSSVTTIQNLGGAMGSNGTFALGTRSTGNQSTLAAATKCTAHADPGTDSNANGTVEEGERYSQNDVHYTLQKFYCTLAASTTGPESVSGSIRLIKTVVCAIEKQVGTLAFDNVARPFTSIVLDTTCASQAQIDDMSGTTGQTSVTMSVAGTVTAATNPTFAEIPGNTYYSHGIKIVSNDGTSLKFVVMAKFDPSVAGDPVESGNFEFATYGSGTVMQGTAVETTAGKISGGAVVTRHLWYEARMNRMKTSNGDALCPSTTGSCGFARHTRINTDISFSGGDISDVSNLSGIISDSGDATGASGQNNQMTLITATGSLSTGLSGKIWTSNAAPSSLAGGDTVAALTAGTATCIMSAGSAVTTTCGGAPAVLTPAGAIKTFFLPANSSTWSSDASTHGGIGFTGAATMADEQFAL